MKLRNNREDETFEIDLNFKKLLGIGITIIVLITIVFGTFFIVPAGNRGILLTFGKPAMEPRNEGLNFKVPIVQSKVIMNVQTQKYEADASAASKDLQIVHTKIAVNYHITPETTVTLYRNIGLNYGDVIIQPAVQETVKQITAQFTAEQLITQREIVKERIDIALQSRLRDKGINMETTSITNFDFSEEFNKAIESKVTAEQNALKEENNLRVIEFQAQQRVATAKGDAEAIQIVQKQLSTSPQYIQYYLLQKWDGKMPTALGSNSILSITEGTKTEETK